MFLKSLEMQGFKSFPDKTVLHFDPGVTAVVGPNGSGKSNISDAIRWVMGEMSVKSLRGSRMEDVIFGGTVDRKPLGFAEVTLAIDNAGHELDVEGDEIRVTRRYYRSGESEYRLNGNEVRLRDIYELFMDTGLGRDGYSIISQGRIAEIVSARSEDRREIFEEAAGISKYRYRKEDAERRLSEAEDNLVRLRDILGELEARVGPLREQAEKAKRYLDLAARKKTLEVGLWLCTMDKQREALRRQETRLELARAQYEQLEKQADEAARAIEEEYLKAQKAAADAEAMRTQAQQKTDEAAAADAQTAVIQNDIARNEADIARLREEMDRVRALGQTHEEEMERREAALAQLREKFGRLRADMQRCGEEVAGLQKTGEALTAEWRRLDADAGEKTAAQAAAGLEQNGADEAARHIAARLEAIDSDAATRDSRREEARRALETCGAAYQKAQEHISELENAAKGYELKMNARRTAFAQLEKQERDLSLQVSGKRQRADMLADLERSLEGFSHSVKAVMRESGRGLLRGVDGPVSRLIRTPAEYAVAVETALGAAAQHIVVEDEEAAKAAIGFLKNTQGGRATFLPLTSVHGSGLAIRGFEQCEGYVGVAGDLVEADGRYAGIVRSLLGRTVVARDLDCAVDMARQFRYAFRIVTLDGQLVNAGGSLTGGSAGHGAGLLTRRAEIEALRREAGRFETQLETVRERKKAAQTELSALEASVSGLRGELQTAGEERVRLEAERLRLTEQMQTLSVDIDALADERAACAQKLAAQRELSAKAHAKIETLRREEADIRSGMESLAARREENTRAVDAAAGRLTELRLQRVACEKDIESAVRDMEELRREESGRADSLAGLQKREEEIRARSQSAGADSERLTQQAADLRAQAENLRQQAQDQVQQRQQMEQHSAGLRATERELSEKKEGLSQELARLEERKNQAQAEYDGLVSRLWEEYELTRSEAESSVPRIDDPAPAQKELTGVKREIKELGDVNVGAVEEYREVSQRYTFLKTQVDDAEKSKKELLDLIGDLTASMQRIFSQQFEEINGHFSHIFVELFGGGRACLRLSEPENVLSSGIEIEVQPPGKIIKSLAALSGGEQAFVAIALYFAILKVRPSPFCVLDEIEAALDDANVARFAAYLHRMCDHTQFIVITHRRGTMESADVLYGVTMQDEGVSKLLRLNVDELAEKMGYTT